MSSWLSKSEPVITDVNVGGKVTSLTCILIRFTTTLIMLTPGPINYSYNICYLFMVVFNGNLGKIFNITNLYYSLYKNPTKKQFLRNDTALMRFYPIPCTVHYSLCTYKLMFLSKVVMN